MPFPSTNLSLQQALADRGYSEPTPVQAAVLQPEAIDRDLLVSAQTGSGKTVAYGLALGSTLLGDAEQLAPPAEPLALMSVGRRNNADPRWLVPIICRLGHITKQEIGVIRIFDRETKFEIAASVAPRFASAARRSEDKDIQIAPAHPAASPAPKGKDHHRQPASARGPKRQPRARVKPKRG
jgi:hypothetical protein